MDMVKDSNYLKQVYVQSSLDDGFEMDEIITDDVNEAIFMLADGTLISGQFECGVRGVDHNDLASLFEKDADFLTEDGTISWELLHQAFNFVRLVPESQTALIGKTQTLTNAQRDLLADSDYQLARY